MEYPGSIFTHRWRLLTFIIFLIIFCVSLPLVLFYTAGFRYDARNGFWRETGSISIDVVPKQTNAYLNNLLLDKTIPIRLSNISPQKYQLRLTAPGYHSWEKEIIIENGKTLYINNLHLIRDTKPELIASGTFEKPEISFDGKFVIFPQKNTTTTILWLYNVPTKKISELARLPGTQDILLHWSTKFNYVAVSGTNEPYTYLIIFDAEHFDRQFKIITPDTTEITNWQWRNSAEPELYYSTANGLYSFLPRTEQKITINSQALLSWFMEGSELWTLDPETTTTLYITKDALGFKNRWPQITLQDNSAQWRFIYATGQSIFLKNKITNDTALLTPGTQFMFPHGSIVRSAFTNTWFISTPSELWNYQEGADPKLVNRFGGSISSVTPLDEYDTLALVRDGRLSILFPNYLIQDEFALSGITNVTADTTNRVLYLQDTHGLWKLNY